VSFGDKQCLAVIDVFESPAKLEAFGARLMPILQKYGVNARPRSSARSTTRSQGDGGRPAESLGRGDAVDDRGVVEVRKVAVGSGDELPRELAQPPEPHSFE